MKKHSFAVKAATVILTVFALSVNSFAAKTFNDVPRNGQWYSEAVYACVDYGWINGYQNGNFGPADSMQRQDFAVVLAKISGADLSVYNNTEPFPDVPYGNYYTAAVAWAKYNGILSGYGNGNFGTGDRITREQFCTILFRFVTEYLNLTDGCEEAEYLSALNGYSDSSNADDWARAGLGWAVKNGFLSGNQQGKLAPKEFAYRGQVAVILYNASEILFNTDYARTPVDPTVGYENVSITAEGNNREIGWHSGNTVGKLNNSALQGVSLNVVNAPDSHAVSNACYDGLGWYNGFVDGSRIYIDGGSVTAVSFKLTGRAGELYDLYYRCYISGYGWFGWAKNGQNAGVEGFSIPVRSIEFSLVRKGGSAPGELGGAFVSSNGVYNINVGAFIAGVWVTGAGGYVNMPVNGCYIQDIYMEAPSGIASGISYRAYIINGGCTEWKSNGYTLGTLGRNVEAVEIKLTGILSQIYDVYYRVNENHFGYSGWAKNGTTAGTMYGEIGLSGIEIRLVPKSGSAPGSSANRFREFNEMERKTIAALNKSGWSLRAAFNWTTGFKYVTMTAPTSKGVNYFAEYGFNNSSGNCYVYAACFYKMAKMLGYDAYWCCGHIQTRSGLQSHGWVEINHGGDIRAYDPECVSKYPQIPAYSFHYGQKGTWKYSDYSRLA